MAAAEGLDDLLIHVGTGRWNFLMFGIGFMTIGLQPVYLIGSDFMNPEPKFTCNIPDDNVTKPLNGSQCFMQEEVHGDFQTVPCKSWTYDTSVFHSTISMEWNLVCDRAWLSSFYQTAITVGMFLGAILGAGVANRYGNRPAVIIGSFLSTAATVMMLLMPWISGVLVSRFLMGTFYSMIICPAFILSMEVCKPSLRTTVGILLGMPYAIMMVGIAGIAYFIRDWRLFQIVSAFPCLLLLPLSILIDESPRWLVVNGKPEEAVKVLERAVRLNRTKLDEGLNLHVAIHNIHQKIANEEECKTSSDNKPNTQLAKTTVDSEACGDIQSIQEDVNCSFQPRGSLGLNDGVGPWWAGPVALFRTSIMRKRMLVLIGVWFMQGMIYIGIALNSGAFSSPFLYLVILGMAEIPAYSLSIPVTKRLGRRRVLMISLIGCGIFLFIYTAISVTGIQNEWLHLIFVYIAYLPACTAYEVNYLFAPELIPTTLRPWGTTACVLSSYIGFSIAPFISVNSSSRPSWIPSVVYGACGILAGCLIFFLPETNEQNLPETVADLKAQMNRESLPTTPDISEDGPILTQNSRTPNYGSLESQGTSSSVLSYVTDNYQSDC